MADTAIDIPDDLWPGILERMAERSVIRLRRASRFFLNLIMNREFLEKKSQLKVRKNQLLFDLESSCTAMNMPTLNRFDHLCTLVSKDDSPSVLIEGIYDESQFIGSGTCLHHWKIICSLDGMLLLRGSLDSLMLCNPFIKKSFILPPIPDVIDKRQIVINLGMGYVSGYKVVQLIANPGLQVAALYSLNRNLWRIIHIPRDMVITYFFDWHAPVLCRDTLFAIASTLPCKVISFDLSREEADSFPLPGSQHSQPMQWLTCLYVDGQSLLAAIQVSELNGFVFVLENSPQVTNWIKLYTFDSFPLRQMGSTGYSFLCMEDDSTLLMKWNNKVVRYYLRSHQYEVVMENNNKQIHEPAFHYSKSLLLLDLDAL